MPISCVPPLAPKNTGIRCPWKKVRSPATRAAVAIPVLSGSCCAVPAPRHACSSAFVKRVFDLVIDFGTSQSPKSTRPLTTYLCPSRPGHQALRNNFASSLLLRTWLPYDWTPRSEAYFVFPLRKARRENSAASRLLGSTSLRFALHGWQRFMIYWDLTSRPTRGFDLSAFNPTRSIKES